MVLIRPDPDIAVARYLKYWLNSPALRSHIRGLRDGSVAERLNMPVIRALPVLLASIRAQRAIARILGALDDKIELNRRTNETLEAMARAIFQSWFVDFDPVRAKMEGRQPEGMDAETARLFPTHLMQSSLGPIPYGWTPAGFGDLADQVRETVDPQSMPPDMPYIGLEHMPQRSIVLPEWSTAGSAQSQKTRFRRGDILFGKLRPYFHKVGVAPVDGLCSTDIVVVSPKASFFGVALGHVSSDAFVAFTNAGADGTKMPRTSWERMAQYAVALPDSRCAAAFEDTTRRLIADMHSALFQSRALATLRDTLLPKLLSGELRVPEAERAVEAIL